MMALGLSDGVVAFPIGGITLDGPYYESCSRGIHGLFYIS
jgi:hypothetical protein